MKKIRFYYPSAIVIMAIILSACSPSFYLREAHKKYQMQDYAAALRYYSKADSNAVTNRMRAKCHYQRREFWSASQWYSLVPNQDFEMEDWKNYANALIQINQKSQASMLLENAPEGMDSLLATSKSIEVVQSGTQCNATNWNSVGASFSPFVVCNKIFYIGDKRNNTSKNKKISNSHGDNLKIMSSDEDYSTSCGFPVNLMNSALDEGPVTMGANRSVIVFTRNAPMNGKMGAGRPQLYEMHKKGLKWTLPRRMDFCNEDAAYMHPTMNPDGNRLIFASNKCGSKGFDLYESTYDGKSWSFPKLFNGDLNTDGDEVFPYLDGNNLYYSTNGRVGFGGLDIFVFNEEDKSHSHLLGPFNSYADDFGITRKDLGYSNWFVSSNRADSLGVDHVFEVTLPKGKWVDATLLNAAGMPFSNLDFSLIETKGGIASKEYAYKTDEKGQVQMLLPREFKIVAMGEVKYQGKSNGQGPVMLPQKIKMTMK